MSLLFVNMFIMMFAERDNGPNTFFRLFDKASNDLDLWLSEMTMSSFFIRQILNQLHNIIHFTF